MEVRVCPRRSGRSNLRAVRDGSRVLRTILRDHDDGVSGRVIQSMRRRDTALA